MACAVSSTLDGRLAGASLKAKAAARRLTARDAGTRYASHQSRSTRWFNNAPDNVKRPLNGLASRFAPSGKYSEDYLAEGRCRLNRASTERSRSHACGGGLLLPGMTRMRAALGTDVRLLTGDA